MAKAEKGSVDSSLPFEEAMKKLETIIESMESDELPLETLLARYEEGNRLAALCQSKLQDAEIKIQKLEKDASGEPVLKPFTPSETSSGL